MIIRNIVFKTLYLLFVPNPDARCYSCGLQQSLYVNALVINICAILNCIIPDHPNVINENYQDIHDKQFNQSIKHSQSVN